MSIVSPGSRNYWKMRGLSLEFRENLIPFQRSCVLPVYFRFTVRHLELRMIQASDNVGNGTGESGVVENRGVAAGISFLCGLELEIWVGGNFTPPLDHTKV